MPAIGYQNSEQNRMWEQQNSSYVLRTQTKGKPCLSALSSFQKILSKYELRCYSGVRICMLKRKRKKKKAKVGIQCVWISTLFNERIVHSGSITVVFPGVGTESFSDIFLHISIFLRYEHQLFVIANDVFYCHT